MADMFDLPAYKATLGFMTKPELEGELSFFKKNRTICEIKDKQVLILSFNNSIRDAREMPEERARFQRHKDDLEDEVKELMKVAPKKKRWASFTRSNDIKDVDEVLSAINKLLEV